MFEIGGSITHNEVKYTIVNDIVAGELLPANLNLFASDTILINNQKHYFINVYKNIECKNPIGFWQTILNNNPFDYSEAFQYQFEINDKTFLISYTPNDGITIHNDINLVDINKFTSINFDFASFTKFVIVKTLQQKKIEKRQIVQRISSKFLGFYLLLAAVLFAYYQYKAYSFTQFNQKLTQLTSRIETARQRNNNLFAGSIDSNTERQQAHIANLIVILNYVKVQNTQIDLANEKVTITIAIEDIELIKSVAKKNKLMLKISKDYQKSIANVTWKITKNNEI